MTRKFIRLFGHHHWTLSTTNNFTRIIQIQEQSLNSEERPPITSRKKVLDMRVDKKPAIFSFDRRSTNLNVVIFIATQFFYLMLIHLGIPTVPELWRPKFLNVIRLSYNHLS